MRKILRGGANRSFGIQVASLAGVPKEITHKAKEILTSLEKNQNIQFETEIHVDKSSSVETDNNSRLLKELKNINTDEITPLKALEILTDLIERIQD